MTFEKAVFLAIEVRRNGLWRVNSIFYDADTDSYAVEAHLITRPQDRLVLYGYDDWEHHRAATEALYVVPARRASRRK